MNRKALLTLLPALALGLAAVAAPGTAFAADNNEYWYVAQLNAMNGSGGSGTVMIDLAGSKATVTEHWTGLATSLDGKPYPHAQHIHVDAMGQCPSMSADTNGDGVVSTTEGASSYGAIGTTLSESGDTSPAAATTLSVAPTGSTVDYKRTFTMNAQTMAALKAGTAVVVVHGLDPSKVSTKAQGEKSDLAPSLPLAATAPALCGAVTLSQMSAMPVGAADTGGGSTAGLQHESVLGAGAALLLGGLAVGGVAAGSAARRRRRAA